MVARTPVIGLRLGGMSELVVDGLSDWVSSFQLQQAAAVWVVGKPPSTECLRLAGSFSIPVVGPEGQGGVRDRAIAVLRRVMPYARRGAQQGM